MKKEAIIFTIFSLILLPLATALTGDVITGEVPQQPTDVSVFVEPGPPAIYIYSPENITYYETLILLNYSIKNELNYSWYNLDNIENISLENLSDNYLNLTLDFGVHTLYLFANNSLGESLANVSFIVSEQPSPPPSSSSGSGGGSSGGGEIVSAFELEKELIEVSLFQGESTTETITIKNTGDRALNITYELIDLEETALIQEPFIYLEKGETKDLNIHLFSLSKILPGLYVGKITFKVGSIEKSVHVIMEIKEKQALFDLNLEVLPQYKVVSPGKKISVLLDMTNIGFKGTAVDVELSLFLMDLEENIVYEASKEMLAVKTNLSITKKLQIPADAVDGTYIAFSEIKYESFTATSYDTFDVMEKEKILSWLNLLLLVIILLFILALIILTKKKKDKKIKKIIKEKIKK